VTIPAPTMRSDFAGFLTREQSGYIFERAARMSVVMALAAQVPLGPEGKSIPVVTGKVQAGWVAEGAAKPATKAAIALKTMDPKKLAAIAVVSAEVVRANPGNYMGLLREQLAEAFGLAFDKAALHDTDAAGTVGGGPFASWLDQSTNSVEIGTAAQAAGGVHGDLTAGLGLLVNTGKRLTGFAMDDRVEPLLWGAVDSTGRPLYVDLPTDDISPSIARPGRLLGRPTFMGEGVWDSTTKTMAYGGDWSQAAWGAVGGINYAVSTEATVTINGALVSLWENNLVAIRAEAEYGFIVNDPAAFVKYVNVTP
jgi:HK97 family phage major capsid protein